MDDDVGLPAVQLVLPCKTYLVDDGVGVHGLLASLEEETVAAADGEGSDLGGSKRGARDRVGKREVGGVRGRG